MHKREIMVLPINGRRADAVRVFSLDNDYGEAAGYRTVWPAHDGDNHADYPTFNQAFTKAFELAAWNTVAMVRYHSDGGDDSDLAMRYASA